MNGPASSFKTYLSSSLILKNVAINHHAGLMPLILDIPFNGYFDISLPEL